MADPLRFLDVDRDDWHISAAVLEEAQRLYQEHEAERAKLYGRAVAAEMSRLYKAMYKGKGS